MIQHSDSTSPASSISGSPTKRFLVGNQSGIPKETPESQGALGSKRVRPNPIPTNVASINSPDSTIQDKLKKLFAFLKDLNDTFYKRDLRELMSSCGMFGPSHLLTITELDLGALELSEIPDEIGLLTNLETLKVDNNALIDLPASLATLVTHVNTIDLANNKFKKLPAVIVQIAEEKLSLQQPFHLYLSGNPITSLPKKFQPFISTSPNYETIYKI